MGKVRVEMTAAGILCVAMTAGAGGAVECDPETVLGAATPYDVGQSPMGVTVADFNVDDVPDLAVANRSGSVSILLGNGNGTFQPEQRYTADEPFSIASADLNSDGVPDVVVPNFGPELDDDVGVLLGNPNGTLQTQQRYTVGRQPASVSIADFDQDDVLDLAVANLAGDNISILLGNGDGSFQSDQRYSVGVGPRSISHGDFNQDGILDLVTANSIGNDVSVLLGLGNGAFGPGTRYPAGILPLYVAVGDLNADGFDDFMVVNANSSTVGVYVNNGMGGFQIDLTVATGTGPASVAIADIDQDGNLDAVVGADAGNSVLLHIGVGDGSFELPVDYGNNTSVQDIVANDLNHDGAIDVVFVEPLSARVGVMLNQCGPQLPFVTVQPVSQLVDSGNTAQFSIQASSAIPVAFQWRRDGVPLVNDGRILGANSSTLTIGNVNRHDENTYDVIVTNADGSTMSDPAVLAVRTCPGDADESGAVDFNDLVATLFLFGPCL